MLIIISRKGFDSSSGGVPSPIFPNGKMLSLPIPDSDSSIKYEDIRWNRHSVGDIVSSLTKDKIHSDFRAHLDPDLVRGSIHRPKGWRPALGQIAAAQGHIDVMKLLLEAGADPKDNRHCDRNSPLTLAGAFGYLEAVKLLMEHGALIGRPEDFDFFYDKNWLPLDVAAHRGDTAMALLLLDAGAAARVPGNQIQIFV